MKRALIIGLLLILIFAINASAPFHLVKADSQGITRLLIRPVLTCCSSAGPLYKDSTFTVDIVLDLAGGESINGFDIRINYTNPNHPNSQTVAEIGAVQAISLSYSNNIFASDPSNIVAADCIDGVAQSGSKCASDDSFALGQLHFAQVIIGNTFSGPAVGVLFSVTFKVTGVNTSIFYFDRANLINPKDESNPSVINPHFVRRLTYAAGFGNTGVVAFFDYHTTNPTLSPSALPTVPVLLNAAGSVNSNNTSIQITTYYWDFGDGTQKGSGITVTHAYNSAGTYTVHLNVTDSNGKTGSMLWPVVIMAMLGSLSLLIEDSGGNVIHGGIGIQVFNTSTSITPSINRTISLAGYAELNGLVPGNYFVKLFGPTIQSTTKEENVVPGWTRRDIVFVNFLTKPQDYTSMIFLASLIVAMGIFTVGLVLKKRRDSRLAKSSVKIRKTR